MQPYEYKTVKYKPKTKMLVYNFREDELDEITNNLGRVGWKLISTELITQSGSGKELLLFFSRQAQSLEEMV